MGSIAIEDLRHRADAGFPEMHPEAGQHGATAFLGVVTAEASQRRQVRTDQPRPDGPLMVGGVARQGATAVVPLIGRILRRQAAQAPWREQFCFDHGQHLRGLVPVHQWEGQAEGEDLVRTHRRVGAQL